MVNAYITDAAAKVYVLDTATNTFIGSGISVATNPLGVAVTPDGTKAYVASSGSVSVPSTVSVIDTSTNTVSNTITINAAANHVYGVAITPDSTKVYVTDPLAGTVKVIDTATNTISNTITVGRGPIGVAITPDGTKAYVSNATDGTVTPITVSNNTPGTAITVGRGPGPVAITPNGSKAFVGNQTDGTVTPITVSNDTAGTAITVGTNPQGIAITPGGTTAYVTNGGSGTVTPITVSNNTAGTAITVGSGPYGVATTPDGSSAYVANQLSDTISVINTSNNTVSTITPPTGSSQPIAFGQFIQPPSIPMTSIYTAPQGRLTLTSNTPVMTADATAQTSIYYTPYQGNIVPIYDGANMQCYTFGQLTMTLNTSNQLNNKNYDLFVFLNSEVVTIGAGPDWSAGTTPGSLTARGSGTGSTQLQQIDGLWVNANTITLKTGSTTYSNIAVGQATYVGSVYMTANGQTQFNIKPAPANGGSNGFVGFWNAYNRVSLKTISRDNSGSYTYASNTWRGMNGNNNNRISWVDGLAQTSLSAGLKTLAGTATASAQINIGVSLNSNSTAPNIYATGDSPTATLGDDYATICSEESFPPQLGFNFLQAMEQSGNAVTATFAPNAVQALILNLDY